MAKRKLSYCKMFTRVSMDYNAHLACFFPIINYSTLKGHSLSCSFKGQFHCDGIVQWNMNKMGE